MLFQRRRPADFRERLRILIWPRKSVWRSVRYFAKRALRLTATPHAIAAGVAAGAFISFTPFLGLHFLAAAALAWLVGGNLLASAIGTAVGNPVTLPLIWASSLELGRLILYGHHAVAASPINLGNMLRHFEFNLVWKPFLLPMTVGGFALGAIAAVALYLFTWWATNTFQQRRRWRLAEQARRRADAVAAATTVHIATP